MKRARIKNSKKAKTAHNTKAKNNKKIGISAIFKVLLILILILIACVFIALGFGFISEEELLVPIDRESGRINALLLGVDDDGLRTDAVMVASLDLETSAVSILSIPRDTKLYVKNRKQTRKMTEIHAMSTEKGDGTIVGPIGAAEAVAKLTGIPINYYVEFSFDSIRNIFDTLGPITYDVPDVEGKGKGMNYEDPFQDLYIHLKPGVQELDGDKLLQFMRYRKGDSDFARMERQQNVIKSVIEQKINLSLLFKLPKLFAQMKREINTNISVSDVKKYSQYLTQLSTDNITTYQLPGESKRLKAGWYFICDVEETKKLISEAFECDTSEISTTVEVYAKGSQAKAVKNKTKQTGTPLAKTTKNTPKATPKATPKPSPSTETNINKDNGVKGKNVSQSEDKRSMNATDDSEKNTKAQEKDPEPNVVLLD